MDGVNQRAPDRVDWQPLLGLGMLVLGATWLIFDVVSATSPNGAPGGSLSLESLLLVGIVPLSLLLFSGALGTLRVHGSPDVRRLANFAAGVPERVITTPVGRALMFLLGLVFALGATRWDALLHAGHPLAALLVLAMALVSGWAVALGAVALYRTSRISTPSGAYLLGALTVATLLLGGWDQLASMPQPAWTLHPMMLHHRVPNAGGRSVWAHRPSALHSTAAVAVDTANVRSSPSMAGSVVVQAKSGTRLEVIGRRFDWLEVRLPDGRQGWVPAAWLTLAGRGR